MDFSNMDMEKLQSLALPLGVVGLVIWIVIKGMSSKGGKKNRGNNQQQQPLGGNSIFSGGPLGGAQGYQARKDDPAHKHQERMKSMGHSAAEQPRQTSKVRESGQIVRDIDANRHYKPDPIDPNRKK